MFPVTGTNALTLAVVFGAAFGWLLHRGRVLDYDVIINQFRLRDFTVLKVMLTAIVVGMLFGAMLYAASFDWVSKHLLSVWKLGKVTLADITGLPSLAILIVLAAAAVALFVAVERSGLERR